MAFYYVFTRGQFWPSHIVIAGVCVCVCLCVRQSWACLSDNSWTVQARITKFGPEKQNTFVKIPIVFFVFFFWGGGAIDLDLPDQIELQTQNWPHFELVQTIPHNLF